MFGFVSKEDKKVLQKVRDNKEKDTETWKYMIRRESATMASSLLLFGFATYVMDNAITENLSFGIRIFASIALVYGIINLIGMVMILNKLLTSEYKKESKEESKK